MYKKIDFNTVFLKVIFLRIQICYILFIEDFMAMTIYYDILIFM